jgi:putative heme-binding domain-containing protein
MKQTIADVAKRGDPARGEAIYRRKDQVCQKCHAIAGAGGQVGPDLTSIGASAQVDYLIESILLPNKAIKENYHSLNIALKDGRLVSGIPIRQTDKELVLRDGDDREVTIPVREIEAKEQGGSLMPEGLADLLTRTELIDLVRFLSELGKVGPYSPSKGRVVRRWQVLEPTPAAYDVFHRIAAEFAVSDDPALQWSAVYSTVAGMLPLGELARFGFKGNRYDPAYVRFQLEATTAGKARLRLNSAQDLTVRLDRTSIDSNESMDIDLSAGTHTVTLAVDVSRRKEALRIELEDVPGSPARVRIVNGK